MMAVQVKDYKIRLNLLDCIYDILANSAGFDLSIRHADRANLFNITDGRFIVTDDQDSTYLQLSCGNVKNPFATSLLIFSTRRLRKG